MVDVGFEPMLLEKMAPQFVKMIVWQFKIGAATVAD
jgi:hypothetical protein